MTVRVEPAGTQDLPQIRRLLEQAQLPHSDLRDDTPVNFWVAREGSAVIGAVGLEAFGAAGLLRSLVVTPRARGGGLGGRLVQALEDAAADRGLDQLVLLTQTAERFFAGRGYRVITRAEAPDALRGSSEFQSLCPATATCMSRRVERRAP